MLCSGILPINQMRDCIDPANIICARVPRHLIEATYGIKIDRELDILDNPHRPPTGTEMLAAYCKTKGYITSGTGRWDDFRACKEILRDFNDGKLLYVAKPPNLSISLSLEEWLLETESTVMKFEKIAERVQKMRLSQKEEVIADVEALEVTMDAVDTEEDHTYEIISDEIEFGNLESSEATPSTQKREHKRLKHWGKKNKKLRDKDPYGESHGTEAFIANIRNRVPIGSASSLTHYRAVSK
jgi:large subunit GTPase 1